MELNNISSLNATNITDNTNKIEPDDTQNKFNKIDTDTLKYSKNSPQLYKLDISSNSAPPKKKKAKEQFYYSNSSNTNSSAGAKTIEAYFYTKNNIELG